MSHLYTSAGGAGGVGGGAGGVGGGAGAGQPAIIKLVTNTKEIKAINILVFNSLTSL